MSLFLTDEGGWPYADGEAAAEEVLLSGPDGETWESLTGFVDPYDDDAVALHAFAPHLLDDLSPLEQAVIRGRFGVDGSPVRTMRELHQDLDVSRDELRRALGSGLAKIRSHLLD